MIRALLFSFSRNPQNWAFHVLFIEEDELVIFPREVIVFCLLFYNVVVDVPALVA